MLRKPLVSVIIPTFNEEKYIKHCLDSLFNQSYKNIEIIIVDDGSKDETINIVKKYKVRLFKQKHKGPSPARNFGAEKAKGLILCFLDADIRYSKGYIETLVEPIISKKEVGTFNKTELVANTNNIWSNCWAINSDLPINKRNSGNLPDRLPLFRAILKPKFLKVKGYDNVGYGQDGTVSKKIGILAKGVGKEAIAYHYNPETLGEVFESARFTGRGRGLFNPSFLNLLRYSFLNSIRISVRKIINGAPAQFLLFKLVYDIGMFTGIFLSFGKKSK